MPVCVRISTAATISRASHGLWRGKVLVWKSASCFRSSFVSTTTAAIEAAAAAATVTAAQQTRQQHQVPQRGFSTTTNNTKRRQEKDKEDENEIILYKQNHSRLVLMRTSFSCATLHSTFWVWYTGFLLPGQQLPGINPLLDSALSLYGIAFATLVQGINAAYPFKVIAKLSWKRDTKQLLVYRYDFPLLTLSTKPPIAYDLGELHIKTNSSAFKEIENDCHGDASRFEGHITLHQREEGFWSMPYLLDIRHPEDVPEPDMLLTAITTPQNYRLPRSGQKNKSTRPTLQSSTVLLADKKPAPAAINKTPSRPNNPHPPTRPPFRPSPHLEQRQQRSTPPTSTAAAAAAATEHQQPLQPPKGGEGPASAAAAAASNSRDGDDIGTRLKDIVNQRK